MIKNFNELSSESFEALLNWLSPDEETAALKYELLRSRLIRIFVARGVTSDAESLVDEVFNRVTRKIPQIQEGYVGEPSLYFYAVANKVAQEHSRTEKRKNEALASVKKENISYEQVKESDGESNKESDCLRKCLQNLPAESNRLLLEYYKGDNWSEMVNRRQLLADRLLISNASMRQRVFRLKVSLVNCLKRCMAGEKQ